MHPELRQGRLHRQGEAGAGVLPALGCGPGPEPPLSPCPPQVGRLHGSVPNLSRYLEPGQLPFSLPPEYSQLQRSFWLLAQKGGTGEGAPSGVWGSRGGMLCAATPPALPLSPQCTARSAAWWRR